MAGKSASLLTKTQRNRIRDDFGDLDEEKKRRDQQRIRERVTSGILDFQHLTDYPDRQLALMFDDVPEDELRAALADTTIIIERLREQYEIDRPALIEEVRTHTESDSNATEDTRTLERIDLRTASEIRQQTKDDLEEQFRPGRWDKRANGLMKLGVSIFTLMVIIQLTGMTIDGSMIQNYTPLYLLYWGLLFLLLMSAIGWVFINTAQSLKYNILPFFVKLIKDPKTALKETAIKLIKNPGETVRASWNEL